MSALHGADGGEVSMGRMRRTRAIPALAGLIGLSLLLGGCVASHAARDIGSSAAETIASPEPSVGDCWELDYSELMAWADWQGPSAVDCSAEHQSDTYAVVTLPGDYPDDWSTSTTAQTLSGAIQQAAGSACDSAREVALPLVEPVDYRVMTSFYVPSQAAWKAGARWVRCDVSILAAGTPLVQQKLADMAPTFGAIDSALRTDTNTYLLCLDSPGSSTTTGPYTPSAVLVDCLGSAQWRRVEASVSPAAYGAKYPGTPTLAKRAAAVCKGVAYSDENLWVSYPTAARWKLGGRTTECWVTPQGETAGPTA